MQCRVYRSPLWRYTRALPYLRGNSKWHSSLQCTHLKSAYLYPYFPHAHAKQTCRNKAFWSAKNIHLDTHTPAHRHRRYIFYPLPVGASLSGMVSWLGVVLSGAADWGAISLSPLTPGRPNASTVALKYIGDFWWRNAVNVAPALEKTRSICHCVVGLIGRLDSGSASSVWHIPNLSAH